MYLFCNKTSNAINNYPEENVEPLNDFYHYNNQPRIIHNQLYDTHPNDNYNDEYIEVNDNINQCSFNYFNNNQKMTTDF